MKFVHLTPQPKIARVKKAGIRLGDGRRNRGVYAVPLLFMEQVHITSDDRIIESVPRSSTTLWRWLSNLRHRHRNLAAVVFHTTEEHWPARLYLELNPSIGTGWVDRVLPEHVTALEPDVEFVRKAHERDFLPTSSC